MPTLREVPSNMEGSMRAGKTALSHGGVSAAESKQALPPPPSSKSSSASSLQAQGPAGPSSSRGSTVSSNVMSHRPYTSFNPVQTESGRLGRVGASSSGTSRHTSHSGRPSSVPLPTTGDVNVVPSSHKSSVAAPLPAREPHPPELSRLDRYLKAIPYCPRLIDDITITYLQREREAVRAFNESTTTNNTSGMDLYRYYASPHYLQYQPEITPKMRVILVDWIIDVHKRFEHHRETLFLTVNIVDRYLSVVNTKFKPTQGVRRTQLQLVAVGAYLIATKYEEIVVPDLKEFVLVAAHSYTKKEVLEMEGHICTALGFRFTVPTSYQFASRLITVMEEAPIIRLSADPHHNMDLLFFLTNFFLEHALLDYNALQFTPSQIGNTAVFLAIVTLRQAMGKEALDSVASRSSPSDDAMFGGGVWCPALQHASEAHVQEFFGCAEEILNYVETIKSNKYQAVRQKYASTRCAEVSKLEMPTTLPRE